MSTNTFKFLIPRRQLWQFRSKSTGAFSLDDVVLIERMGLLGLWDRIMNPLAMWWYRQ